MAITVSALRMTPVKALRISDVESVELGPAGARGDRAFYLVDDDGALVNGKRVGELHTVCAEYDAATERLALRFADGERVEGPVALGETLETSFFGTPRPARVLDGPWSAALSRRVGQSLRIVSGGPAVDRGLEGAVSLVSAASLQRLARAPRPDGTPAAGSPEAIDPRRFRMLIEIDGVEPHAEDGWIGREIEIGEARLRFHGHVGRCVTTTRGAESGTVDLPTLKMLATYRTEEPTTEPLAFGVHGAVLEGGTVRVGDLVRVVPPPR